MELHRVLIMDRNIKENIQQQYKLKIIYSSNKMHDAVKVFIFIFMILLILYVLSIVFPSDEEQITGEDILFMEEKMKDNEEDEDESIF